ncbi:MAG: UpxY family transcription antiterminator [Bacteroidales bacterium]|nr:UpxY family transcription antiterminator [Bacteroidales bacterium]
MDRNNELHWFVGLVKSCQERKVAEVLTSMGVESYLPIQRVKRVWSDRVKLVDKLVLPRYIFIHTTENNRVPLLQGVYGLASFIARGTGHPIVVPDVQMGRFMQMVAASMGNLYFSTVPLAPGDEVTILEGTLAGLTCEIVKLQGSKWAVVRLGAFGNIMTTVDVNVVRRMVNTVN